MRRNAPGPLRRLTRIRTLPRSNVSVRAAVKTVLRRRSVTNAFILNQKGAIDQVGRGRPPTLKSPGPPSDP